MRWSGWNKLLWWLLERMVSYINTNGGVRRVEITSVDTKLEGYFFKKIAQNVIQMFEKAFSMCSSLHKNALLTEKHKEIHINTVHVGLPLYCVKTVVGTVKWTVRLSPPSLSGVRHAVFTLRGKKNTVLIIGPLQKWIMWCLLFQCHLHVWVRADFIRLRRGHKDILAFLPAWQRKVCNIFQSGRRGANASLSSGSWHIFT